MRPQHRRAAEASPGRGRGPALTDRRKTNEKENGKNAHRRRNEKDREGAAAQRKILGGGVGVGEGGVGLLVGLPGDTPPQDWGPVRAPG